MALASFITVLAVTVTLSALIRIHLLTSAQARFDWQAARVTADLHSELLACAQDLRRVSAFIAVAVKNGTSIEPNDWRRSIALLHVDNTLPLMRAAGYAIAPGIAENSGRAGTAKSAALAADARDGKQPFAPVVLTWPEASDTGIEGRDLGGDAEGRAALLRAADTGQITLYARAAPPQSSSDSSADAGLYLPVYRDAPAGATASARRAALAGFVFARLDVNQLVRNVAVREPRVDLRITAGTPGVVLYRSPTSTDEVSGEAPRFHHTDALNFGGEPLTLFYTTNDPSLIASAEDSVTVILAAGTLAALMSAAAVYVRMRKRVMTTAEAGVAHSQSTLNEARMMAIIRSSMEAIITIDESQRIVIFNPMAERVFGCSAMDAIGAPIDRFIPERFRAAHHKHVDQFGVTGVSERQMGRQRVLFGVRANGEEFPIEASISQIQDNTGKLYTVMLRDVTERVRAENALKTSREELRELSANLQNVREEEKTRIARELHDDLGQQLTALKMDLSAVEKTFDKDTPCLTPTAPAEVLTRLGSMRLLIDATVASVRRIAADLRPVMLDDLGLVPAIEWLANDFSNRYDIKVECQIEPGDTCFTRIGATTLFRIVQEALTNVARHAEASRVKIALSVGEDQCMLRIADNGRGVAELDAHHDNKSSFGLLGIRERAHMLRGTVAIETSEQHGFTITVLLPLAAVRQEETLP